jgi:hypothetical protein
MFPLIRISQILIMLEKAVADGTIRVGIQILRIVPYPSILLPKPPGIVLRVHLFNIAVCAVNSKYLHVYTDLYPDAGAKLVSLRPELKVACCSFSSLSPS